MLDDDDAGHDYNRSWMNAVAHRWCVSEEVSGAPMVQPNRDMATLRVNVVDAA
jgi:hypothetical protein